MTNEIDEKFNAAVDVIKNLPKNGSYQPSNELMLQFYSLFKQATIGNCDQSRPAFYDVVNRAKHDAWLKLKNMSSDEAKSLYVNELKKVIETMPHTEEVSSFLQTLGSFYEVIDLEVSTSDTLELDSRIVESETESDISFYEVAEEYSPSPSTIILKLQAEIESLRQKIIHLRTSQSFLINSGFIIPPFTEFRIPTRLLLLVLFIAFITAHSPMLFWRCIRWIIKLFKRK